MSFLSILKAIGLDIAKGISILGRYETVLPALAVLNPAMGGPIALIDQIIKVVIQVEASAASLAQNGLSISGEQKMLMAAPQVAQVLAQTMTSLGKPTDPAALTDKAKGITQAIVDVLNGFAAPGAVQAA